MQKIENESDIDFDPDLFVNRSYQHHIIFFKDISINLKALFSASSTDHDLTGQIVWPASYLLATFLVENRNVLLTEGVTILELGAGTGLVGLIAAKIIQSPSKVTITDGNPIVMDLLRENIYLNFNEEKPLATNLEWGCDIPEEILKKEFNLILGSDVIFWPDQIRPLFLCLQSLLNYKTDAVAYISYTKRCETTSLTMLEIANKYFNVSICPIDSPVFSLITEKHKHLTIYKFTNKNN